MRVITSSSRVPSRSTSTSACTTSRQGSSPSSCPTGRTRCTTPRPSATIADLARGADVVHAHGLRAASLAVLATARTGVPVVSTLHNAAPTGTLTRTVYAALERVVARGSSLVLGVSADLVERMERLGARRAALAVVAAPRPRHAVRDRFAVRAALGVGGHTALGVVVARLAPQKGLDLLLDAHRELPRLGRPRHGRRRRRSAARAAAGEDRRRGPPRAPARAASRRARPAQRRRRRHLQRGLGGPAGRRPGSPPRRGGDRRHRRRRHRRRSTGEAALLVPAGDPVSLSRAIRDVVLHGAVRDELRSRAVERSASLPTREDALAAALTAYHSVVPAGRGS